MTRALPILACAVALLAAPAVVEVQRQTLRVCADPNNLPFSNEQREGFENKLAESIAREMGGTVEYTWWPQRRGFIRNTLQAGLCDVVLGVPTELEMVLATRPYYRSTYVFVSLRERRLALKSLDDPRLHTLRVGVQMIGDDFANSPPAHALSARGIVRNVVGYSVLGDYSQPNPPARIVDAVIGGDVDAAIVWGPLAGYFAARAPVALEVTPVSPQRDGPTRPFAFDISIGVRRGDAALHRELDGFIRKRRAHIDAILDEYHVPRVSTGRS